MSANGVNEGDLLQAAKAEVIHLRDRLQQRRNELQDTDVATYARRNDRHAIRYAREDFRPCRTLRGHTGKIYSLDWSYRNKNRIVSASQDGRLIVWNALTSQKTHAIKLTCSWVMTCAFSPDGHSVACGGLDNNCSIFGLNSHPEPDGNLPVLRVLYGHRGYLSCCRYVPDEAHIITSSGDRTCRLWDGETFNLVATFGGDATSGHAADVMSVSISTSNQKLFVSGSCDKTARLWDTRVASRPQHTYYGHRGDINAVQFLPDGLRFGTGSDDGTCKLFDTRTGHLLQTYEDPNPGRSCVTSLAFSHSGRILFAGYENQRCYLWDAMLAEVIE
ncbi:hypothetical protein O6H91_Y419300 [Diphasiastrum complanatum]|nr:hypothetical protein O6H91_Y419300 [Diphasiastrum complanatum]